MSRHQVVVHLMVELHGETVMDDATHVTFQAPLPESDADYAQWVAEYLTDKAAAIRLRGWPVSRESP